TGRGNAVRPSPEVAFADRDALRSPRRAGRVRHRRRPRVTDGRVVVDLALGRRGQRGLVVAVFAHHAPWDLRHAVERTLQLVGDDDRGGARVADEPAGLVRLEVDVDRHDDGAEAAAP